jgi:hypothetical protein
MRERNMRKCEVLEGCKLVIIWIRQVNAKNGTAADVINECAKLLGRQMSATNFIKVLYWYVF